MAAIKIKAPLVSIKSDNECTVGRIEFGILDVKHPDPLVVDVDEAQVIELLQHEVARVPKVQVRIDDRQFRHGMSRQPQENMTYKPAIVASKAVARNPGLPIENSRTARSPSAPTQ